MNETSGVTTGLQVRLRVPYPAFELNVDLALPGNQVTALFGPSGSGKTTCLRAMAGLERVRPERGEKRGDESGDQRGNVGNTLIMVNGDVWQDDANGVFVPPHLRPLGYVFQEASLFAHLSVAQNLKFGQTRRPSGACRWTGRWSFWALATCWRVSPRPCQGGSANAWQLPAHWPPAQAYC